MDAYTEPLTESLGHSLEYLSTLFPTPIRPIAPTSATLFNLQSLPSTLPQSSIPPTQVLQTLATTLSPSVHACSSGRYFGFVTGATLPAALGADWLVSTYDQTTWSSSTAPACAHLENLACKQLLSLLSLPPTAGASLCGGATIASIIAFTAARNHLYSLLNHDCSIDGLIGAPPIQIYVGAEAHSSVFKALSIVGLPSSLLSKHITVLPTSPDGSIDTTNLPTSPATPSLLILQAGHVNTGSFDLFKTLVPWSKAGAGECWIHVDGAFGLWAGVSGEEGVRGLVEGVGECDSWATDLHKMINCPYDNAFVAVRNKEAVIAAMSCKAPYLATGDQGSLETVVPELQNSRRARGVVAYAALQSLGREGLAALVDGCIERAARLVEIVVGNAMGRCRCVATGFNQALLRFDESDEATAAVVKRVVEEGLVWFGCTNFRGITVVRVSVVSWATTDDDIDVAGDALIRALKEL